VRDAHREAAVILSAALLAACLASCAKAASGGSLSLEAERDLLPRLEAMLESTPLPSGWRIAGPEDSPLAAIKLEALPAGEGSRPRAAFCGSLFLAASVGLADEDYSVDLGKAEKMGLRPLESILPPRRALAVGGLWPGQAGYPFSRRLYLSLAAWSGRPALPLALRAGLARASAAAAAADRRPLVLAVAGDVQVGDYEWPLLDAKGKGMASLLRGGALGLIGKPDLAVANIEAPISAGGFPNPRKRFQFRMPPGSASAFKAAGLDLALFANNHGFDFGAEAFEDTLADFAKAGLPMAGAGRNLAEASAAKFLDAGPGASLAFVGFAFYPAENLGFSPAEAAAGRDKPGVAEDEAAAMDSVRAAAASGATVVVLAHGGAEYVTAPTAAAKALYARFAEAGAALVAGSHPHLLQGCEARGGSLIAYSLGNFLFTGEAEPPEAWNGAVLDFLIYRGKVRGLAIHPIIAGYDYTALDPDQAGAEQRFSALCAELEARGENP
jgi:poly-gamma-glutamate capsule biosynthesis protein CapA/YwtB (metallophosphatase superfamily)